MSGHWKGEHQVKRQSCTTSLEDFLVPLSGSNHHTTSWTLDNIQGHACHMLAFESAQEEAHEHIYIYAQHVIFVKLTYNSEATSNDILILAS